MPELPEVESTKRALERRLLGRRIAEARAARADLRFPLPEGLGQKFVGRRIARFGRRAKYILWALDDGAHALLHLGMSGRLIFDGAPAGKHEHLTFRFDDADRADDADDAGGLGTVLRFVDPRRFGSFDWSPPEAALDDHPRLRHLGLEPLSDTFDGAALAATLEGRRSALKTAIMDQRLVVGVGNIYASEALFRARLAPMREAGSLSLKEAARLASSIRAVLAQAIDAGGSSLRDYVQADGELGNFQSFFDVYGRGDEPCRSCGRPIVQGRMNGRAYYWCPDCQR